LAQEEVLMRARWKRVVLAVAAVVVGAVGSGALVLTNPALPRSFEHPIEVSPADLRHHVEGLIAVGRYRDFRQPEVLARAADWIRGQWEATGHAVEEQPFEVEGNTYRNLILAHGPAGAPLLVVGAHYDVCGEQDGADDNASGVAAILELARLLAAHRPQLERQIMLVAFCLEEPPNFRTPNMGSAVHARSLREQGARVEAMLALDMLGYYSDEPGSQGYPVSALGLIYPSRADFISVVGDLGSLGLTRAVKARMAGASEVPVWSINAPRAIPGIDFSDHQNYWAEGYPAVMVTDTAFYRSPNYHQASDTADTLDYERLAEVVKGLYATIVTLD
jgi:hypothetical protein